MIRAHSYRNVRETTNWLETPIATGVFLKPNSDYFFFFLDAFAQIKAVGYTTRYRSPNSGIFISITLFYQSITSYTYTQISLPTYISLLLFKV